MSVRMRHENELTAGNNFSWFLGPFLLIAVHSDHLVFGINSNDRGGVMRDGEGICNGTLSLDVHDGGSQISISALVEIHPCYPNLIF